jgi:hypothetical protein
MRVLLGIVLLALCLAVQSQQPSPSPAKPNQPPQHQTGSSQQQTSRNQNITVKSPIEIKLLNTGKTPEETKQEAEDRKEKSSSDWWMVGLTGVLGFLAFLQLLAFIVQARVASRTVNTMADTAQKELRAYVFIESASIGNTAIGQNPKPGFTIKNFGKTPAYEVSILLGYGFGDSFEKLGKLSMDHEQRGTLGPTAYIHYYNFCPRTLTSDDISALQSGTHFLFVYGEIRYVDFTGESRTTKFRLKAMKNAETGLIGPQFEVCKDGNDAD